MDLTQLVTTGVTGWDVLFAVLSVVVGWIVAHYARKGVLALVRRVPNISETIAEFAARFAYYLVFAMGIGLALAFLGANVQPLLAVVIIAIVVVILVLRGVADNFAAGVLIQTRQTLKVGDEIQVEGPDGALTGVVHELGSRAVLLRTTDGRTVHMPNAKLLDDAIVNHSTAGMRRSEVQVRLERDDDTAVAALLEQIVEAAAGAADVAATPPARALATTISPDRVTLRLQFWHPPLESARTTAAVVGHVAAAIEASGRRGTVTSTPGDPPLVPPDTV